VETRKVADLKPHPENARVYGDGADAELVVSIRGRGILVPLLVSWDDRVIAGHRRLDAAKQAGLADVPVTVFPSRDELDIKEALVHANRQRVKTNEQLGREAALLLAVEKERAKQRQQQAGRQHGRGTKVVEPIPQPIDAGKSRDRVGEALGVSGKTAERAAVVVETIDALSSAGQADEAARLRRILNARGIEPAYRQSRQATREKPAPPGCAAPTAGEAWEVVQADCLDWLPGLPEKSVDLFFFSPPYEAARTYGIDFALSGEEWVAWMARVFRACLGACKGLVACVCEGQTRDYRWSAAPALLMADLHRAGICLRKPPAYKRVGIPGSGGREWLRNDYEFIVCATPGGRLPWADNTAMGHEPKYQPGGPMSHRTADGRRVNGRYHAPDSGKRKQEGPHRTRQDGGYPYIPPERANPGNVIDCGAVGGGNIGDDLAHQNEAPFPEQLAEFFVRSFCPAGGLVCDPFCGSGTTAAVALRCGRRFKGCDVRHDQVELTRARILKAS
jgi:ParB-like chromosome segregation protein Spo0J